MKLHIQKLGSEGGDQSAQMCRLICVFAVHKSHQTCFLMVWFKHACTSSCKIQNLHYLCIQRPSYTGCLIRYEPGHKKTCLMSYANNKAADQPAHPCSLISTFVVRCLDSVMSLVSVTKISSLMLASVAEQASLSLTWSETPEDTFSHDEAHISSTTETIMLLTETMYMYIINEFYMYSLQE